MVKKSRKNYFKAVVNAFDGSVYVCSPDNVIEYVNQRTIDEIGRGVTGEYCYQALHNRNDVCPWCREQSVFEGKTVCWEYQNLHTGRWSSYTASPVFHSDGTISKLTLCSDITDIKRADKALKESNRRLETLMSNLPGMVYRCKADENVTMEFASDGAYRLLGYYPPELTGKGKTAYQMLVDPRDRQDLIRCVNVALNEKRSYSFIYRVKKKSGNIAWVWEQGEGIFSEDGKLIALEGFITDITRHKKAELDLRKENTKLKTLSGDRYKFGDIIGKSSEMQAVYDLIVRAACTDVNVIVFGESGTGKELVARNIHRLSDRSAKSFVTVNCGAINENLLESEFFGYKKGAFTGAAADTPGYLDKSNGGTLFLDELGEMGKSMQVMLLRAIERREYTPVGGNETKTSNFRIIAATHRNLAQAVKNSKMREDFYYRINILSIHLPSLRERKDDIPLLIDHFVSTYPGVKSGKPHKIPGHIKDVFCQYDWPGNVRELQNAVHRYIAVGQVDFDNDGFAKNQDLHKDLTSGKNSSDIPGIGLEKTMAQLERKVIENALAEHKWNRGNTASFLKVDRKTLYRKIKFHGLGTRK